MFSRLYQEHFNGVYRYVAFRVPAEEADDIVADIFTRAWEGLHGTQPGSNYAGWLYTIAHNRVVDYYRQKKTTAELTEEIADTQHDVARAGEQKLNNAMLRSALAQLRPASARVLEHRFLRELSVEETARELGMSAVYVRVQQHRALKELQQELEKKGWKNPDGL